LQLHRKQQDQKDGEPEVRNSDPKLRHRHHADITNLVVIGGGVDAGGQGQHYREQHRHDRQRNRQREPLRDQLGHRRAVGIAVTHIADQKPADPVQIANDQRLIEPELDGHRADRFRRGVRAHEHFSRVARQRIEHEKDDHRRSRQRRNQCQKAPENEDGHAPFPFARNVLGGRHRIADHPIFRISIQ
jgi:hypothetical protein